MKKSTFSKNSNNAKFVALAFLSCLFVSPFLLYLYLAIGLIYFLLKTDMFKRKSKKKIIGDNYNRSYAKLNRKDFTF